MDQRTKFERFRDRWLTPKLSRYVAVPLLAAGPGAVLAWWFDRNANNAGTYFLKDWKASVTLVSLAWAGGVTALRLYVDEYAGVSLEQAVKGRDELLRLIAVVRLVVGAKTRRFHETYARGSQLWTNGHKAFVAITQPEQQIREIVEAIYVFFDGAAAGDSVRVALMRWDERKGHLVFCEYHPPLDPPDVPESAFNDRSTVAGLAFFDGKMVISEDVSVDPNFRRFTGAERGSMFAFPVQNEFDHRVAFVVNVCSRTTGRFKKADEEQLRMPMRVFADRLILEEGLAVIKRRVEQLPAPARKKAAQRKGRR